MGKILPDMRGDESKSPWWNPGRNQGVHTGKKLVVWPGFCAESWGAVYVQIAPVTPWAVPR